MVPTTGQGSIDTRASSPAVGMILLSSGSKQRGTVEAPGWILVSWKEPDLGSTVGWRLWCLEQSLEAVSFLSLEAFKQQLTLQRVGCRGPVNSWKEERMAGCSVAWSLLNSQCQNL